MFEDNRNFDEEPRDFNSSFFGREDEDTGDTEEPLLNVQNLVTTDFLRIMKEFQIIKDYGIIEDDRFTVVLVDNTRCQMSSVDVIGFMILSKTKMLRLSEEVYNIIHMVSDCIDFIDCYNLGYNMDEVIANMGCAICEDANLLKRAKTENIIGVCPINNLFGFGLYVDKLVDNENEDIEEDGDMGVIIFLGKPLEKFTKNDALIIRHELVNFMYRALTSQALLTNPLSVVSMMPLDKTEFYKNICSGLAGIFKKTTEEIMKDAIVEPMTNSIYFQHSRKLKAEQLEEIKKKMPYLMLIDADTTPSHIKKTKKNAVWILVK